MVSVNPEGERIRRLFLDAVALQGAERRRFLDRLNHADRKDLEGLLAFDQAGNTAPGVAASDFVGHLTLPLRVGHFRLVRHLGVGGMGHVYLAEDERLLRQVAVKFIRPDLLRTPRIGARFVDEARALARLDHPGICAVLEVGESDHGPFIAMQLVRGRTLHEHIYEPEQEAATFADHRRVRSTAEIGLAVARALDAAHEAGVLHHDLKPANVILQPDRGPVLLDFGIARVMDAIADSAESGAASAGTPAYMSPERKTGRAVPDPRDDVYALGVTLFECLTGEQPAESVDPRDQNPAVPGELARIVVRATASERDRRTASAAEMAHLLSRFLEKHRGATVRRTRHLAVLAVCVIATIAYFGVGSADRGQGTSQGTDGRGAVLEKPREEQLAPVGNARDDPAHRSPRRTLRLGEHVRCVHVRHASSIEQVTLVGRRRDCRRRDANADTGRLCFRIEDDQRLARIDVWHRDTVEAIRLVTDRGRESPVLGSIGPQSHSASLGRAGWELVEVTTYTRGKTVTALGARLRDRTDIRKRENGNGPNLSVVSTTPNLDLNLINDNRGQRGLWVFGYPGQWRMPDGSVLAVEPVFALPWTGLGNGSAMDLRVTLPPGRLEFSVQAVLIKHYPDGATGYPRTERIQVRAW